YYFKLFDRRNHTLEGVHVYKLSHQFRLSQRIEARTAVRTDGEWLFRDGLTKKYLPDGNFTVQHFDRQAMDLPEVSGSFVQTERSADEMGLRELTNWIRQMKAEGYDPLRYQVELHLKLAFPFICTIMTVIGLPIAFWKEKGGGIALGIGAGIGLSFVYLVVLGLSRALGYSGLLPPAAAAWLPNVLFILLGLYLFTYVRQ
ncbi:MAG: LptF/LptG family permease, partial [Pseudomonadota bacterium]